jgi:hypothetical protein
MTTIKLKNGSGAPTAGDLAQGEPALDLTNKRLYTEDSGGTVIEVGTNPTSVTTGAITSTGIDVTGEVEADTAHFGTGTGTGTNVADEVVVSGASSTGLTLHSPDASNATLAFGSATDNDYAFVQGYYNSGSPFLRFSIQNSEKAKVTSTGIDVTGTVTADGAVIENSSGATLNVNTNSGAADSKILLHEGTTASPANGASIRYDGANNIFKIGVGYSVDTTRLTIDRNTGDISFYEDTGTTAKLFWDASAESLGIGKSNPSFPLDISGERARISGGTTTSFAGFEAENDSGNGTIFGTGGSGRSDLLDNRSFVSAQEATSGLAIGTEGADPVLFYTNGTTSERLRIDSSGSVGIGTSSPQSIAAGYGALTVGGSTGGGINFNSTGSAFAQMYADTSGFVMSALGNRFMSFRTNDAERMRIDSSGNVKIGTNTDRFSYLTATTANLQIDGGVVFEPGSGNNVELFNYRSTDMLFGNGGAEAMRIDSVGNVGIGTSSPAQKLHISGTGFSYLRTTSTSYGGTGFDIGQHTGGSIYLNNRDNTPIIFQTNNTERMRIDSSGNLLVGKTSASVGTDGAQFITGGYSGVSATSTTAFFANRNTTDGDVVEIGKNGVKVGSIGYGGGGILFNAASQYGLKFYDAGGSNIIHPATTAGGDKDASVDLGYADSRFKDLYLSSAVRCPDYRSEGVLFLTYDADDSLQIRRDNGAEAARFDSSGNLLVGKSSQVSDGNNQ